MFFEIGRMTLVSAAIVTLFFPGAADAQQVQPTENTAVVSQDVERLRQELEQLRAKNSEIITVLERSLENAIEKTDEIVSGLSKRLAAADNVPPETVASILALALDIFEQTEKGMQEAQSANVAVLPKAGLLQKLIEVDIKTSIAATQLTLGRHHQARKTLEAAESRRGAICEQEKSIECDLRAIRIARTHGLVALGVRPRLRTDLAAAYSRAEAEAINRAEDRGVRDFKLDGARPQGRDHQLFISYWRTQVVQADTLLAIAQLRDAEIQPAQRKELLKSAKNRVQDCENLLKPPRGAREGNIDLILNPNAAKQSARDRQSNNDERKSAEDQVRAACRLMASMVNAALARFESGSDADKLLNLARDAADDAAAGIAPVVNRNERNLPVRKLALLSRIQRGLLRAKTSPEDRSELIAALRTFTDIVRDKDYPHAELEQAYLDLIARIREARLSTNLSGAESEGLGLPADERIRILSTAIELLANRIKLVRDAGKLTRAKSDRDVRERETHLKEERDLQAALAANALPLFSTLHKASRHQAIADQYKRIRDYLPRIEQSVSSPGDGFAKILRINYFAGHALRSLGREADAIEIFYKIEASVLPQLKKMEAAGSTKQVSLLRYLHAYATRSLGDIRVEDIGNGQQRDKSLKLAFEQVDKAQRSDSDNIEFKFALASVLYNQALRAIDRGQFDEAQRLLERARTLGSDDAAMRLVAWARNGTGPDGRVDRERAERLARERREKTPFEYEVRGVSEIFPEEDSYKMYILDVRDGIERAIDEEIRRLKTYYGVREVEQTYLARLRDIYQKARRSVGEGAILNQRDLERAKNQLDKELKDARPYGDGELADALSRTDTLINDEDYGRARDTLDTARAKLSDEVRSADDIKNWGLLSLHYLKVAEANQRSGNERNNDLIKRVKDASQRALTRATDLRLLRAGPRLDRRKLFETLSDLAQRSHELMPELRRRSLSYETNKSYALRLNEITRQFHGMAIDLLTDDQTPDQIVRTDLEILVDARKKMATYAREGAITMRWVNEELRSEKTRLFTRAMRELATAYNVIEDLEKRFPENASKYALERLSIQKEVANVHFKFEEEGVARRLALEAAEDAAKLIEQYRDNIEVKKVKADIHDLVGIIAFNTAKKQFNELQGMLEQIGDPLTPQRIAEIKNPNAKVFSFARSRYFEAAELYDLAREHFEKSVDIREEILSIEADAFCACRVNDGVRDVAIIARLQEFYDLPKRAGLPTVKEYLDARILRWEERADDDLNPDSTRFARWYLARAYALRDDLTRPDQENSAGRVLVAVEGDATNASNAASSRRSGVVICEKERYVCADEEFRKIKAPTNEMLADHALLLSDKAFFHLKAGVAEVLTAERTVDEAYELWLKLPYSVWVQLNTTDLNIPANYAHVKNVKSIIGTEDKEAREDETIAREIYAKYRGSFLDLRNRATWDTLVKKDMCILRDRQEAYKVLDARPIVNNNELVRYCRDKDV